MYLQTKNGEIMKDRWEVHNIFVVYNPDLHLPRRSF
jgi:hypothetical protein